jgi:hypothetical protein
VDEEAKRRSMEHVGSAWHRKRRYCSRVSLSALRTIGIEASASRTRRSRGGRDHSRAATDEGCSSTAALLCAHAAAPSGS